MKQSFTKFAQEYVKNGGKPVPAAIAAGYSPRSAASQASVLLKNPKIKAYIARLTESVAPECLVDHKFVISRLKEVVERCMTKAPVMEFDRENMEWGQKQVVDPASNKLVGVWSFDAGGANKALELIGRHLKMFVDKVEFKDTTDRAALLAAARARVARRATGGTDPD